MSAQERRVHGSITTYPYPSAFGPPRAMDAKEVWAEDPAAYWEGFCPNCHVPLGGDVRNWCPQCKAYWNATP